MRSNVQYAGVMTTMNMIYHEIGKALTTKTLLEEMHLQFRLSGGKSQKGDKDSDKEEEVALTATGKKGGKSEGKKKGDNPNANKKCNHCEKKGHVEADCWKKFPDKIPDKVKLARKKAEEKKAVAAAAVVDEVILGAIDEDLIPSIAAEFENINKYETTNDNECKSDDDYVDVPELFSYDDNDKFDDGNSNDASEIVRNVVPPSATQKAVTVLISGDGWMYDGREKSDGIDDVECALVCVASTMFTTIHMLESELSFGSLTRERQSM